MPRLIKDKKSALYFFRWTLPNHLKKTTGQTSLYLSLQTRDKRAAIIKAALLNLRVERLKYMPEIDLDSIRKLLTIDVGKGIFQADTAEEQNRGLQILEAMTRAQQVQRTLLAPVKHNSTPATSQTALVNTAQEPPALVSGKPFNLEQLAAEHLKELAMTLKRASLYKYQTTYKHFKEYIGSKQQVQTITRDKIKSFKQDLMQSGKMAHTVNGYMGQVEALFAYAIANDYYAGENPAINLLIKNAKRQLTKRDQFHDEDLQNIFDWKNYEPFAIKPDYYWAPLICLFTGMRIEEATSLAIAQIKTMDSVPVFNITDAKTQSGIRVIPIHKQLVKMGFLEYVQAVKDKGFKNLFWYLTDTHNGTKKNLSRRFSDYLKKIQTKSDSNCFHSLRHTVITRMVARNVSNSTIYKLTGHTSDKSTHYNYLHDLPVKSLQDGIETIDFEKDLKLTSFKWQPVFLKTYKSHPKETV